MTQNKPHTQKSSKPGSPSRFPKDWKPTPDTVPDGYHVFREGDEWMAVGEGYRNLQESEAGFGDTPDEALEDLRDEEALPAPADTGEAAHERAH